MHEAKVLVVVVLISVSLDQLLEVGLVQFPAKSGNKGQMITKNNPKQKLTFPQDFHFYYVITILW